MSDGFDHIRTTYGVPAKKGGRVEYTGGGKQREGVITGTDSGYVMIRLDGDNRSRPYHPNWNLRYLTEDANS